MENNNIDNLEKNTFKYKAVDLLENKVSKTIVNVYEYEKKQVDFLKDIRKLNQFLAEELENNKNHNTRKDECKEKIEEMKLRISNVKENLNSARNCLIKALNNKNIKSIIES
jgi:hypothetical protein